jgi:hypothetical protein
MKRGAAPVVLASRHLAPPGSPILGGFIEATFDARPLDRRAVYLAGIAEEGRETRRIAVDFSRIE